MDIYYECFLTRGVSSAVGRVPRAAAFVGKRVGLGDDDGWVVREVKSGLMFGKPND